MSLLWCCLLPSRLFRLNIRACLIRAMTTNIEINDQNNAISCPRLAAVVVYTNIAAATAAVYDLPPLLPPPIIMRGALIGQIVIKHIQEQQHNAMSAAFISRERALSHSPQFRPLLAGKKQIYFARRYARRTHCAA